MKSTVEIENECKNAARAVAKAVIAEVLKRPDQLERLTVPALLWVWRVVEYAERIGMQAETIIGARGELAMAALLDAALGQGPMPPPRLRRVDQPIFVEDPVWFRVGTIAASLVGTAEVRAAAVALEPKS